MLSLLIFPCLTSLFLSLVITPVVIAVFKKKGWVDKSKNKEHPKHIHTKPVPRGGGISIFLAVLVTALIFLTPDKHLKAIFFAASITLLVGVVDDLFNINPYLRILTNSIAALIIINSGIKVDYLTNPFGGILDLKKYLGPFFLPDIITLVWILWCINVVGWSAGVDGQLPGFVSITGFVIGLLSLRFSQDITQWPVIVLAGAVSGAYLGFLPFNFHPQKIMPGYSGKSLAGLLIAILAILSGAKLATVILTLGIPMLDGLWAIIRRTTRGRMPVWGDAEHLHHLLLKVGVNKPLIAIIYWLFSATLGAIVLQLNSKQKIWALLMVATGFIALVLNLKKLIRKKCHSNFSA
ncbi:undecaprenyl/decaprenyl-phosphate alpha-N-acetylglucosaminyl 1-phosphate transferase [Patescibacteria group bacterium]|nr:undecaprenyl/decaprenyl-phosphate alpha-N-acetylglucosaminyl 1-phosphate transferase [Patescibacteria group bacterium]